ncbi:MAG: NAD(P)/FAD-dependent oxidoreductase [Candidatus Acidiferrales bacterium]
MSEKSKTRILILGGGFAGLYAALEFEKALARSDDLEVTLINRDNFFLFTPMLHEVAASDLDITHIVNPIRKLLRRVKFFHGSVESLDLAGRRVLVSHSEERHHHSLAYDHLVIGLGSVTNFFSLPGLERYARTMKSLGDAIELRNHLIELLEAADLECAIGKRDELLTVVVAGGGFAGVETIAGVNDFLREALQFYPHLSDENIRVVLVHPGSVILPELGESLGRYAQKKLAERKVEIRVNSRVTAVDEGNVTLDSGEIIATKTVVWAAGTSPNPLLQSLPCRKGNGRLAVNAQMEVAGWPGVWALGDCAAVPDRQTGRPCPPTAQHALRQGRVVARNVLASIRGGEQRPFEFATLGQLAAIGRRTGVARILGMNFSGFFAWWLWRTIYLSKLPRLEKKLRVALDWSLDLLFSKDLVQFNTGRSVSMSPTADAERAEQLNPLARDAHPIVAAEAAGR